MKLEFVTVVGLQADLLRRGAAKQRKTCQQVELEVARRGL